MRRSKNLLLLATGIIWPLVGAASFREFFEGTYCETYDLKLIYQQVPVDVSRETLDLAWQAFHHGDDHHCGSLWSIAKKIFDTSNMPDSLPNKDLMTRQIILEGLTKIPISRYSSDNDLKYLIEQTKKLVPRYNADLVPLSDLESRPFLQSGDEVLSYLQRARQFKPKDAHRAGADFLEANPEKAKAALILGTAETGLFESIDWLKAALPYNDAETATKLSAVRMLPEIARSLPHSCSICEDRIRDDKPMDQFTYSCYLACREFDEAKSLPWLKKVFSKIDPNWSPFRNKFKDNEYWIRSFKEEPEDLLKEDPEGEKTLLPVEMTTILDTHFKPAIFRKLVESIKSDLRDPSKDMKPIHNAISLSFASTIFNNQSQYAKVKDDVRLLVEINYFTGRFNSQYSSYPTQISKLLKYVLQLLKEPTTEVLKIRPPPLGMTGTLTRPLLLVDSMPNKIARKWLYEIVRNPEAKREERAMAWGYLMTPRLRGAPPDGCTADWILGDRKVCSLSAILDDMDNFNILVKTYADIDKNVKDPPRWLSEYRSTWKAVLSFIMADWISARTPTEDKPDESLETFHRMAVSKLQDKNFVADAKTKEFAEFFEKEQENLKGLYHVHTYLSPTPQEDLVVPRLEMPKELWPLKDKNLIVDPKVFLEILTSMGQYRNGLGIVNLAMEAHQRWNLSPDDEKLIYRRAFQHVKNIRQLDILLNHIPTTYLTEVFQGLTEKSPTWTRLSAMVNTCKESLDARIEICTSIAEYLATNAKNADFHGVAFLILDSFRVELDYVRLLHNLSDKLQLKSTVSLVGTVVAKRLYRTRNIWLRLEEPEVKPVKEEGKVEPPPDPEQALQAKVNAKLGPLLMKTAIDEDAITGGDSAKEFLRYFVAGREEANAGQWEAAVNNCKKDHEGAPKLLAKLFAGMSKKTWWSAIEKNYKPKEIEEIARIAGLDASFDPTTDGLCDYLAEYLVTNIVGAQDECTGDSSGIAATYRTIYYLTTAKREVCKAKLFEATTMIAEKCKFGDRQGNPMDFIQEFFSKRIRNYRPVIAAAIVAANTNSGFSYDQLAVLLKEALVTKPIPAQKEFRIKLVSIVLQDVAPKVPNGENKAFVKAFVEAERAESLPIQEAQTSTPYFRAAFHIFLAMGYKNFNIARTLMKYWEPKEPADTKEALAEFVKILSFILMANNGSDAEKLYERVKTDPFVTYVQEVETPSYICDNITKDMLLSDNFPIQERMTAQCIAGFKVELPKVIGIPKIASRIGDVLTASQLQKLPANVMRFMTAEQMVNFGTRIPYDDLENPCNILKSEAHTRQLHLAGALRSVSLKCLQLGGPNWIIALVPSTKNPEPSSVNTLELASMLTKENFSNIDMDLLRLANLEVSFWQNLGTAVQDIKDHPCVTVPRGVSVNFWTGITRNCLLAPRLGGGALHASSLLKTASSKQLNNIPSGTWDSLGEEILSIPLERFAYFKKEKREMLLSKMKMVANEKERMQIISEFESLDRPYLAIEFDEAEVPLPDIETLPAAA